MREGSAPLHAASTEPNVTQSRRSLEREVLDDRVETGLAAVGDVVGFPSLASAAYDQGRFAATHLVEGRLEHELVRDMPTGIYTSPEISSLGKTERELTAAVRRAVTKNIF